MRLFAQWDGEKPINMVSGIDKVATDGIRYPKKVWQEWPDEKIIEKFVYYPYEEIINATPTEHQRAVSSYVFYNELPNKIIKFIDVEDFTKEEIDQYEEGKLQEKRSSMKVTPLTMLRTLTALGLREAVEQAISAADQDVKDAWNKAIEFDRLDPLVVMMGTQILGKTEEELDQVFEFAMGLSDGSD